MFEYKEPQKIINEQNHQQFAHTQTFNKIMQFIVDLQKSVESQPIQTQEINENLLPLIEFLNRLDQLIQEIPPLQQKMRFGNKAFITWYEEALKESDNLFKKILNEEQKGAEIELKKYLTESFGNSQRIDYGTGHELNFLMFLLCLKEIKYLQAENKQILIQVFYLYINLVRKLQLTYMLEPAGSHGVWGLDDYHFLPFLFGASELIDSKDVPTPLSIHDIGILKTYENQYMYLQCIKFIKEVKKGVPFHECSPVLNDISGAANWTKVANGLIKMYQAEVLFKVVVAKHIMFGGILPFN